MNTILFGNEEFVDSSDEQRNREFPALKDDPEVEKMFDGGADEPTQVEVPAWMWGGTCKEAKRKKFQENHVANRSKASKDITH